MGYDVVGELEVPGSRLGADPATEVVRTLGVWAIRFLLLTLMVSTVRRRLGFTGVMRYRRMLGLAAFGYAATHFAAYAWLLAELDVSVVGSDLTERPYIIAGFLALLLLLPLAITSTNGWRRRLGRRWFKLHRLVYAAMGLVLLHHLWLTKDGYAEPAFYLACATALALERLLAARVAAARAR